MIGDFWIRKKFTMEGLAKKEANENRDESIEIASTPVCHQAACSKNA
jgi:hypothetical protein